MKEVLREYTDGKEIRLFENSYSGYGIPYIMTVNGKFYANLDSMEDYREEKRLLKGVKNERAERNGKDFKDNFGRTL
jgi:hypothetical protein